MFSLLVCAGTGVGISYVFNVGPMAQPGIVGKWESLSAMKAPGTTTVFRSNGTGVDSAKADWLQLANLKQAGLDSPEQLAKMEIKDGIRHTEFKWTISREEKPVLLIEIAEIKTPKVVFLHAHKDHYYFKREGDTLTLTDLQLPFPQTYRKAQP